MNEKQRFDGLQKREVYAADCSLRVLDEDKEGRTVELSFSSETPIERWGAYEILSHKKSAVMLDRINKNGCLLFNHNRDKILGTVVKAQIKDKRGVAIVKFDSDAESLIYLDKVKSGSLRNVSVGYIIHEHKREVTGKGESVQVTYTATKWEPLEISLVSVPADITVGVGRSMADEENERTENSGGYKNYVDYLLKINQNLQKIQ